MNDPAVALLAAWVAEIDEGVDEVTRFVMPRVSSPGPTALASSTARGRRTALIVGSTVLALVVSGGAAAAVTGDPLALVRAPLHAIAKVNPFAGDEPKAHETLPEQTPDRAKANKLLADAHRALANGDPAKAQTLLTEATALLGGAANPGQQNRIGKLTGDLPGQSGSHQSANMGTGDKPDQGPKGPGDKGPGDKGLGDKASRGPKGSHDPKGKGQTDTSPTKPSTGTSKGGSSKPRKGDTSGNSGKSGTDQPKGPPSTSPTKAPKASPNG